MWRPIEPLKTEEASYVFREIDRLQRNGLRVRQEVEQAAPDAHMCFTKRLTRILAIETGIIKRIYEF